MKAPWLGDLGDLLLLGFTCFLKFEFRVLGLGTLEVSGMYFVALLTRGIL